MEISYIKVVSGLDGVGDEDILSISMAVMTKGKNCRVAEWAELVSKGKAKSEKWYHGDHQ